ncbi:MAG: hypothetical protein BJ554DRAFT_2478 [Olpidium bornovanus]|uniref:Uncharacterized protein n=1 Tax=Olpidium bornovanus TaxID=278681 RepID=A0A8H8DGL2_9FUNG|nr:MAG: hypothetical protein BJ554DRAFT_2478 [Olpidium bornovanus]
MRPKLFSGMGKVWSEARSAPFYSSPHLSLCL